MAYRHPSYVPQACNEILNAGTIVLVAPLVGCANYPVVHTLTVATNAIGDEEIDLTSDQTLGTFLREGTVLHFGANTAVTTADVTVLTTATAVPVEPLVAVLSGTCETWAMSKILSPTNVPLNLESQTVDRTDLNSFRGSSVKTLVNYKPQITAIASLKDRALYQYIFDGAKTAKDVYVSIVYSSMQLATGRALVEGFNADGAQADISKPQFTLSFQGKDYETYLPWIYETAENKLLVNEAMKLSGVEVFTA